MSSVVVVNDQVSTVTVSDNSLTNTVSVIAQGPQGPQGPAGTSGAEVYVSTTPPPFPNAGDLWWDSNYGKLQIYYTDINSSQWVDASIGGGGGSGGGGATVAYSRTAFTATAGQTNFSVAYAAGYVLVYVNGVLLNASDYTATNGTTIVLSTACASGDIFEAVAFNVVSIISAITSFSPLATAPSSPTVGMVYFDTVLGYPRVYGSDSTWHGLMLS